MVRVSKKRLDTAAPRAENHLPSFLTLFISLFYLKITPQLVTDSNSSSSYTPSQADVAVFKAINPDTIFPGVARWYTHIKSYEAEFGSLSGSSSAGEAFLGGSSAAPAAAPAKADDDDDEVDLFGSDDEEDAEAEKLKAERVAAYNAKKAAKPKTVAKVCQFSNTLDAHLAFVAFAFPKNPFCIVASKTDVDNMHTVCRYP